MPDIPIRLRRITSFHFTPVPIQFFISNTMGHDPQQRTFRKRAGVTEVARRAAAFLTGFDPFGVVTDGVRDGLRRSFETLEFFRRQKLMSSIV